MITALIHRDHITITVFVLLALLCCCLVMAQTLRALANSNIIVLILASISQILSDVIKGLLSVVVV